MIGGTSTRLLYENLGPRGFVHRTWNLLGLADKNGRRHKDLAGNPVCRDPKIRPEEFSLKDLAESIVGPNWEATFNPQALRTARLLEASTSGVDPTAFANISGFNATVGGLIEMKVLEGYANPAFIGERLAKTEPTKLNGQRMGGIGAIGDKAEERKPGMPHRRAGFFERWVDTPETREFALACEVTREAVAFDLTGDVLRGAESVGLELGYRREIRIIDTVIGITNTYKYKGTTTNTYLASGGYVNRLASNPITSYDDIDEALQLFVDMTDPETGKRILVLPKQILVMPAKRMLTEHIINSTLTEIRTGPTPATGTYATGVMGGANVLSRPGPLPMISSNLEVLSSPLVYQRAIEADGLNLSAANAKVRWWIGDFMKAFYYMQNFPMEVLQGSPTDVEMIDRGIIASYFAHERGTPAVIEPRNVAENTH